MNDDEYTVLMRRAGEAAGKKARARLDEAIEEGLKINKQNAKNQYLITAAMIYFKGDLLALTHDYKLRCWHCREEVGEIGQETLVASVHGACSCGIEFNGALFEGKMPTELASICIPVPVEQSGEPPQKPRKTWDAGRLFQGRGR